MYEPAPPQLRPPKPLARTSRNLEPDLVFPHKQQRCKTLVFNMASADQFLLKTWVNIKLLTQAAYV